MGVAIYKFWSSAVFGLYNRPQVSILFISVGTQHQIAPSKRWYHIEDGKEALLTVAETISVLAVSGVVSLWWRRFVYIATAAIAQYAHIWTQRCGGMTHLDNAAGLGINQDSVAGKHYSVACMGIVVRWMVHGSHLGYFWTQDEFTDVSLNMH